MEASKVSNTLFTHLGYRGERQKVISSNIANINTPNFKAKELVFKDELQKSNDEFELKMRITNAKHISGLGDGDISNKPKVIYKKGLLEQNDGNNVNLDREMSSMAKNNVIFNAIQSSIKKDANWFKAVIDASSKN